ncbi:hypothetical protein [Saccharothrix yanglingensis]|nr:hypothetical protein [Saccharothrix yanglingensis]
MPSTMDRTRPAAAGREWSGDAGLVGQYLREINGTPLRNAAGT